MRIDEIVSERSQAQRKADVGVEHDQFFTRPEIAASFAAWVKSQPFYSEVTRMVEPAAGARALSRHFPGIEEYDIDPQYPGITKADFLASGHSYRPGTLTIMNPPFGRGSDLAIAFFNKAAEFSDYIAGIFPRSFRRGALQRRLNARFHLVDERVLPRGAFYLPAEGRVTKYDVPSVAQIWVRKEDEREDEAPGPSTSRHFRFVGPQEASFAFRRKGRRAGEVVVDGIEQANPNSFYFIAGDERVLRAFQEVDWSVYGQDAIGARYITKAEIVQAIEGRLS